MSFLRGAKDTYKKTQAGALVAIFLERYLPKEHADDLGYRLVKLVWNSMPRVFDGTAGRRPHKFSVAAAAIAHGIESIEQTDPMRKSLISAFSDLNETISEQLRFSTLSEVDHSLLISARDTVTESMIDEMRGDN